MHDKHTLDGENKDLTDEYPNKQAYLDLAADWKDPLGLPKVVVHDGVHVVRDDEHLMGTKGRWGDLLVSRTKSNLLVYVGPRVGFAGISLARLCQKYQKKLVLFCPSSKASSDHQRLAMELGADLRFVRIAAMPVLNKYAKEWAEKHGGQFLPLGLKHPLITAAGVNSAARLAHSTLLSASPAPRHN